MKTKFLRKIAQLIQHKPTKFAMEFLHADKNGIVYNSCGTTHCIAGWGAVILGKTETMGAPEFGDYLGVDGEARNRLCFVGGWPSVYANRYEKAATKRTKAKVAAERIEHFIKTAGRE